MLRPKGAVNDFYIGVAEEETEFKVGSRIFKASINVPKFISQSSTALEKESVTDIYRKLLKGNEVYKYFGIIVELIFTKRQFWEELGAGRTMEIVKTLNLSKDRSERTILEVNIEGISRPVALKCIECEVGDITSGRVKTLVQKEIIAFDKLPEHLKGFFVTKYAHGRLWFDNSSYEVILMEKMAGSLNRGFVNTGYVKDNPVHYVWLANAFKLLHTIHVAGFSHGDAYSENVLWSDGLGKGKLKFIDPERMVNFGSLKCEIKNILKLNDIAYMLLNNSLANYAQTNPKKNFYEIDFEKLHQRLILIKKRLRTTENSGAFFFDQVLPYHTIFLYVNTVPIGEMNVFQTKLKRANPEQYKIMESESLNQKLDDFTLSLTDPLYLKRVFVYILNVINRSTSPGVSLSQEELNFPLPEGNTSLPQPTPPLPRIPLPAPKPPGLLDPRAPTPAQVSVNNGSTGRHSQLTYRGQTVQSRDDDGLLFDVFFSIGPGNFVTLSRFIPTTVLYETIFRSRIREMYADNKPVESVVKMARHPNQLYFNISTDNSLEIFQLDDKKKRYVSIEKVTLTNTPSMPAPTHSTTFKEANTPKPGLGVFPLRYHGGNIQVEYSDKSLMEIYYTIYSGGNILLTASDGNQMHPYDGNIPQKMYSNGILMEIKRDNSDAYFKFNYDMNTLIILKKGGTDSKTFTPVENIPFLQFHQIKS